MHFPFALIFAAIGGALIYFGYKTYKKAQEAKNWPTTQGVVISSEVVSHRSHSRSHGHRTTYGARVQYEYTANGQKYSSTKISYGDYSSSNIGHAQAIVDRYPPQTGVMVYYNPQNPQEAVLEPGKIGCLVAVFIIGGLFAFMGLMGLLAK